MNILLTNDDGYFASGIISLYEALSPYFNTFIVAPDDERSGCSNAITTRANITMKNHSDTIFSVTGFPADCINIAVHSDFLPDFDMVISGINHGPNLGDDIIFSGTVAGARVARMYGITGIAVSIDSYHKPSPYFNDVAQFIFSYISDNKAEFLRHPHFMNINYPNIPAQEIRGVKYTSVGKRIYQDSYKKSDVNPDEMILTLDGSIDSHTIDGTDATEIKRGYISITPLTLDTTDKESLKKMLSDKNHVGSRFK